MTLHKLLELSESQRSFSGFAREEINVPSYPKLEPFHGNWGMGKWVREMSPLWFFSWVLHSWARLGFSAGFLPRKGPLPWRRALGEKLEACREWGRCADTL